MEKPKDRRSSILTPRSPMIRVERKASVSASKGYFFLTPLCPKIKGIKTRAWKKPALSLIFSELPCDQIRFERNDRH
jgi:hypothetical protein